MNPATDLPLPGSHWPLRLAFGLLLAACVALVVQQRRYQAELRTHHEREQLCRACTTSPTE